MTGLAARKPILDLVADAVAAGARQQRACAVIGMNARTLQRWRSDPTVGDRRPARVQQPINKLDDLERQHIVAVANSAEFGHLPPSQIVPRLADQGRYLASESTFYRVLKRQTRSSTAAPRGRRESQQATRYQATGPCQL